MWELKNKRPAWCHLLFSFTSYVLMVSVLQASACNTDTTPTQPYRNSNTHRTKNNTTNTVIQQNSRKFLMMDILMSETCWAHKKWNKIASDITLVFYSSTKAWNLHKLVLISRNMLDSRTDCRFFDCCVAAWSHPQRTVWRRVILASGTAKGWTLSWTLWRAFCHSSRTSSPSSIASRSSGCPSVTYAPKVTFKVCYIFQSFLRYFAFISRLRRTIVWLEI